MATNLSALRLQRLRWYVTDRRGLFLASNFADYSAAHKWAKKLARKLRRQLGDERILIWSPEHLVMAMVVTPADADITGERVTMNAWNRTVAPREEDWLANRAKADRCPASESGMHQWLRDSEIEHRCAHCGVLGGLGYMKRVQSKTCMATVGTRRTKKNQVASIRCGAPATHMVVQKNLSFPRAPVCDKHIGGWGRGAADQPAKSE